MKKIRFVWSVNDARKVAKALSQVTKDPKERRKIADGCVIEIEDPEVAGAFRLALSEEGVNPEVREIEVAEDAPVIGDDAAAEEAKQEEIDAKAELVKALSLKLASVPDNEDRVKAWLEICEAETDVVVLVAAGVALAQAGVAAHLLAILEDRVRVLNRPGPGETKVLDTWVKELDVVLDDEQVMDRYERGAQRLEDADQMEDTAKDIAKSWKARIQVAKDEGHTLLTEARTRTAKAKVECQEIMDYGTGKVRTVRTDTGATISEREASERELQLPLPFEGKDEPDDDASTCDPEGEE